MENLAALLLEHRAAKGHIEKCAAHRRFQGELDRCTREA